MIFIVLAGIFARAMDLSQQSVKSAVNEAGGKSAVRVLAGSRGSPDLPQPGGNRMEGGEKAVFVKRFF